MGTLYYVTTETRVDPPTAREPRPVVDEPALTGKRLIVASEHPDVPGMIEYRRDYRAASEVFTEAGRAWVRVVPELQWYAWTTDPNPGKSPACPRSTAYPADCVWVE